jgi:hypothetical protein
MKRYANGEFVMKQIRLVVGILAVLLVFGQVTVFAQSKDRKEINDFLKSYETVVVAAEKAAKSNKITDLMDVQQKAIKMSEQANKIQGYKEWTVQDSQKYLDLTNRYTIAMSALSNSANTGSLSF